MLYALYDYIQYKTRNGKYGDDPDQNMMAMGHLGKVSNTSLDQLEEGDIILTQKLDSIMSWGVMYFGSSLIDHIAFYIGNGRILHMTLAGSKVHKLSVFNKHTRILPVRAHFPKAEKKTNVSGEIKTTTENRSRKTLSHYLPPKFQLVWAAIRVMFGLHQDRFRWKFLIDCIVIYTLLDLTTYFGTGYVLFFILSLIQILSVFLNKVLYWNKKRKGEQIEPFSHPDLFLHSIDHYGATFFTNDQYREELQTKLNQIYQNISSQPSTKNQ